MNSPQPPGGPLHATPAQRAALEVYLLGVVNYDVCLALQQRLIYESTGRRDGQISLLLCEHPLTITLGRRGSRSHIQCGVDELTAGQVPLRWVNHGGGTMVHAPGQLAIYPIVPLAWHGWTVGEYLSRLRGALQSLLEEASRMSPHLRGNAYGIWGRSGQLASWGISVKNWTTYHGAFVNVTPALDLFRQVQTDPRSEIGMSSLVVERQQAVKMTAVREGAIRHLSQAFDVRCHHLHSGHPLLPQVIRATNSARARVG